jgi:tRNA-specific 2-thiouridylase
MPKVRALLLFSGGLDSLLAGKVLQAQGIEVWAVRFITPFFHWGWRGREEEFDRLLREKYGFRGLIRDVSEEYLRMLRDPPHGFGSAANPCIDCKILMLRRAREMLPEVGADFLATGEVVGQRPMSQRPDALQRVSKLAGDNEDKLILRPLSAKLLEPTRPEIEGWVDRERLLDISGRGRERQLAMAAAYGWEDYESPGGGCLLTDPAFSQKLRDFIAHEEFGVEDIDLLKHGRHFRLPEGAKLVVGRHQEDNEALLKVVNPDYIPVRLPIPGPYSLLYRGATPADRELAARIALTYGKSKPGERYEVKVGDETYEVEPFESKAEAQKYFVLKL